MNVYLAGGGSRPYVFMNIFLAGGISGNISASWKKLAHDIEQCASISQERTEKAGFSEKSTRGGNMILYLAGEHPVKNGNCSVIKGGKVVPFLKVITTVGTISISRP